MERLKPILENKMLYDLASEMFEEYLHEAKV